MLVWFAETTLIATALAAIAAIAGRLPRLGPAARHTFWLVVLIKLVAPPVVSWPWSSRLVPPWSGETAAPSRPGAVPVNASGTLLGTPKTAVQGPPFAWRGTRDGGSLPDLATIGRVALGVWAVPTATLMAWQTWRVLRFRRRLRWSLPAPGWLADEANRVGKRLGTRAPEILILPGLTTPMLWFLGRPVLLVPATLVEVLGSDAWRVILAHELAHLLRCDHWVRRLELAAGLLWWWNPLYWMTRRRLDAEAELSCDERAILAFPDGRIAYAEALLQVCGAMSKSRPLVLALGVNGPGQFLEKRVTRILGESGSSRTPPWLLMGVGLLGLLALPGWSEPVSHEPEPAKWAPSATAPTPASGATPDVNRGGTVGGGQVDAEPTDRPKSRRQVREPRFLIRHRLVELKPPDGEGREDQHRFLIQHHLLQLKPPESGGREDQER